MSIFREKKKNTNLISHNYHSIILIIINNIMRKLLSASLLIDAQIPISSLNWLLKCCEL